MDISKMVEGTSETVKVDPSVQKWREELDEAFQREKNWRKEAARVTKLYECGKQEESPFNILYSNTETLSPALYNNLPRPVVGRRFRDEDPLGKACAQVVQRSLEFLIDNTVADYTPFDTLIEQAVLEAIVPGRGIVWFKYDADIVQLPSEEREEDGEGEGQEEVEGSTPSPQVEERVNYETVCGELVPWDRFRCGYGKTWKEVPWIAREHYLTRDELIKNFGEIGKQVKLDIIPRACDDGDDEDSSESERVADAEGAKLARVYEIWDKETRKVKFLATGYPSQFVKEVDDPLELSGFFPTPRPLHLFQKITSMVPVTLYATYEEQAKELNRITTRINKLVSALRVRGFYDSTVEGLEKLMEAEDNKLLPAENVAALQDGKTLDKSIWLMPIEKLIAVLQQLYVQRQQVKQVIYEITGISDILRGTSVASETATAQNIKNQWGTLRLKRMQKRVMVYVRDCLRIMAEVSVTKFSAETLSAMTGLTYPTAQQKAQAQQILSASQQAAQAGQQVPPPPPAVAQFAALPTWEEIKQILNNDLRRAYKIDIETNSTVDAEATEDKQNMGEFLNAVAQFLNGAGPLVQQGILPFEVAKGILLAITRRYRFGVEVEDEIKKMQAPPPPQEGKDGAAEATQKAKVELQIAEAEAKLRMELLQTEQELKKEEARIKLEDMRRKEQLAIATHSLKMREWQLKAAMPQKSTGVNNS